MVQTVNNIGKQSDAENLMIHLLQRFEARAALLKETAKKSSRPVTGLWNRGPLQILNGIKLIMDDQRNHLDSYTVSLESFRSFRGPLFRKPVAGQELFFAASYSKPALVCKCASYIL